MAQRLLDIISTISWVFALVHFSQEYGHDFEQIFRVVHDPTN